ncbi:hypothetical protein CN505_15980 [Bacillus cereus]|uniref:hypothetical protein n=1 Tax=Bacillus toyonensis TaxID=155322 RepID=UPI000BEF2474|nr:hypothetical protein [Bacillus toyonensis]PEL52996.1 hypothetical protein CN638_09435 [Bacillus toyonensis]PET04408.1 hypothetical protein CN505_15980 [Bacillus cereus]
MINKIIVTLIQERVAEAFGFPVYKLDNDTVLDRDLLAELLFEMEDKDPSFYVDDIITEAHKVGMTAEEVLYTLTEICNAYKDMIVLLAQAPQSHKNQLIDKFLTLIDAGLCAEAKTLLN